MGDLEVGEDGSISAEGVVMDVDSTESGRLVTAVHICRQSGRSFDQ